MKSMGNNTNTQLKQQVMRKVYIVAYTRRFLRPLVLKGALLTVFLATGLSVVSVTNVIKNALQTGGAMDAFGYFLTALTHTEFLTQALFAGIVVLSVGLVVDMVKDMDGRHPHMAAY